MRWNFYDSYIQYFFRNLLINEFWKLVYCVYFLITPYMIDNCFVMLSSFCTNIARLTGLRLFVVEITYKTYLPATAEFVTLKCFDRWRCGFWGFWGFCCGCNPGSGLFRSRHRRNGWHQQIVARHKDGSSLSEKTNLHQASATGIWTSLGRRSRNDANDRQWSWISPTWEQHWPPWRVTRSVAHCHLCFVRSVIRCWFGYLSRYDIKCV